MNSAPSLAQKQAAGAVIAELNHIMHDKKNMLRMNVMALESHESSYQSCHDSLRDEIMAAQDNAMSLTYGMGGMNTMSSAQPSNAQPRTMQMNHLNPGAKGAAPAQPLEAQTQQGILYSLQHHLKSIFRH